MESWQLKMIEAVFESCFGMKELVLANNRNAIVELMFRTGFRIDFIDQNFSQILSHFS